MMKIMILTIIPWCSAMEEYTNSTRRELRQRGGRRGRKCMATNPIDRCWRCRKNWAQDRQLLAKCGKGFGRRAVGGLGGPIYVVTDDSDNDMVSPKPGTLRYGVVQKGPLWIIFARSMVITLQQELLISSDKTIDGRGANVQIRGGAGLTMQFVNNVIVHGIRVKNIKARNGGMIRDSYNHVGMRTRSDGDAISIFGSSNIWIDHLSLSECEDGLVDVIQGSTAITISNCHMTKHNDVTNLHYSSYSYSSFLTIFSSLLVSSIKKTIVPLFNTSKHYIYLIDTSFFPLYITFLITYIIYHINYFISLLFSACLMMWKINYNRI